MLATIIIVCFDVWMIMYKRHHLLVASQLISYPIQIEIYFFAMTSIQGVYLGYITRPLGGKYGASNNHNSMFRCMIDHVYEASLACCFSIDHISHSNLDLFRSCVRGITCLWLPGWSHIPFKLRSVSLLWQAYKVCIEATKHALWGGNVVLANSLIVSFDVWTIMCKRHHLLVVSQLITYPIQIEIFFLLWQAHKVYI